ncbi:MAG TPA: PEGA domain-containing protein, partial [Candidatus Polarisedimenticolia bacterium]|nr:PEGA domain-containing protein [Candidatus Polarisedimenticolia bacterium]
PRAARRESAAGMSRTRAGVRVAVIGTGALALVLLLPRSGTRDDRWGALPSSGAAPFHATAAILSGTAPPPAPHADTGPAAPPQVALPGQAETAAVTLRTDPPGGRIYLDDVEVPGGIAHLPRGDNAPHVVVAEDDCHIEKVTWKRSQGSELTIKLRTPKIEPVPVGSTPRGAAIFLDGKPTGRTTPAEVPVPVCGEHKVALRLEGYKDVQAKVAGGSGPVDLALPRIPEGFLAIAAAPYPVQVLAGGRRIGEAGKPIKLAAGSHKLVLRNEELFVERSITVEVQADRTVSPKAPLPALGSLTVLASPSNCTIYVNGRELGAPPINDHPVAAGTYKVRAVYIPTGESQEASVTVAAGAGARVPFKFQR